MRRITEKYIEGKNISPRKLHPLPSLDFPLVGTDTPNLLIAGQVLEVENLIIPDDTEVTIVAGVIVVYNELKIGVNSRLQIKNSLGSFSLTYPFRRNVSEYVRYATLTSNQHVTGDALTPLNAINANQKPYWQDLHAGQDLYSYTQPHPNLNSILGGLGSLSAYFKVPSSGLEWYARGGSGGGMLMPGQQLSWASPSVVTSGEFPNISPASRKYTYSSGGESGAVAVIISYNKFNNKGTISVTPDNAPTLIWENLSIGGRKGMVTGSGGGGGGYLLLIDFGTRSIIGNLEARGGNGSSGAFSTIYHEVTEATYIGAGGGGAGGFVSVYTNTYDKSQINIDVQGGLGAETTLSAGGLANPMSLGPFYSQFAVDGDNGAWRIYRGKVNGSIFDYGLPKFEGIYSPGTGVDINEDLSALERILLNSIGTIPKY